MGRRTLSENLLFRAFTVAYSHKSGNPSILPCFTKPSLLSFLAHFARVNCLPSYPCESGLLSQVYKCFYLSAPCVIKSSPVSFLYISLSLFVCHLIHVTLACSLKSVKSQVLLSDRFLLYQVFPSLLLARFVVVICLPSHPFFLPMIHFCTTSLTKLSKLC